MKTRLSVCRRKVRYASAEDAQHAAREIALSLRVYPCDRCNRFHLTSRTKGKRVQRPLPTG